MSLNYIGLYYLVPTAADQPILIINMEKPQKKKVDDFDINDEIKKSVKEYKIAKINQFKIKTNKKHKDNMKKARSYCHYSNDGIIDNDTEHETEEDDDDNINIEMEEIKPLLKSRNESNDDEISSTVSTN